MPGMSTIYFAQIGLAGPIKVGITAGDARTRIAALQTGCPWTIRLVGTAVGHLKHESWLHERFASEKVNGEWFNPTAEVLAAIADILRPDFVWPEILHARRARSGGALGLWLADRGVAPADFGKTIGRSQAAVSRYMTGARIPDREAMIAIFVATDGAVKPNDFYDLPTLASHQSVRA